VVALTLGLVVTVGAGLLADGVYHEDDFKHFLLARWSRHDPAYLLDWWGRPGFTLPYALVCVWGPPEAGWHAARLLSAVLTAATAALAWSAARHWRVRHAWLAIVAVYLQPMTLRLSQTTLTETPLAFYLSLATWLLLRGRPGASAAVMALAPLTRHEAVVLWPVWALAIRRAGGGPGHCLLMGWAMAAHNVLARVFLGSWPIAHWFQPEVTDFYGSGTFLTYVPKTLMAFGPGAVLAVMGARRLGRRPLGWLPAAGALLYVVVHTLVFMRGAYASGGYARFLVPLSPWVAVLACAGVGPFLARRAVVRRQAWLVGGSLTLAAWVTGECAWLLEPPVVAPRFAGLLLAGRLAGLAAAVGLAAVLVVILRRPREGNLPGAAGGYLAALCGVLFLAGPVWALTPLRLKPEHLLMRDAVAPLDALGWRSRPRIIVNYWLCYWAGMWVPHDIPPHRQALRQAPEGTLFIWDARFCPEPPLSLDIDAMRGDPDWRLIWRSGPVWRGGPAFLAVFERRSNGPAGSGEGVRSGARSGNGGNVASSGVATSPGGP